ncbi:hypothetical protein MSSIT_3182 [Methanosarcina siciliae T4/M]|uniref:Uncharacterized protein n=1 Tax=Methanosarcina siciliae T4/M TaxID=1434120 RepID=A0A0E3L999_9EURY|nr:hypothetical protein [Methanosarcina siciliae]AKB29901.1 hypothetical protein MSSIT_3182 [Methanosarcina siciliae T4/M]
MAYTRTLSNTSKLANINKQEIREAIQNATPTTISIQNTQREAAHAKVQNMLNQVQTTPLNRAPTETELSLMKRSHAIETAYNETQKQAAQAEAGQGLGYTARPEDLLQLSGIQTEEQSPSYTYSVYDYLGREQTISEKQYNQLAEASKSNTNSSRVYTVIPEEVANSQADWWINSQGLYEWVPVTASDKAHLAKINKQRARSGLPARTTLTSGASPSQEYSEKWYSTGGKRTTVQHNEKLAKMKAGSSANANASAKSRTAQDAKATVISTGAQKEAIALSEESKIRNPLTKYESKDDYLSVMTAKKEAAEAAEKARAAYNPILDVSGNEIAGIEVKGASRESTAGIKGIISGEGYYSRDQAVSEYKTQKAAEKKAAEARKDLLAGTQDWLTAPGETANIDRSTLQKLELIPAGTAAITSAGMGLGLVDNTGIAEKYKDFKESGKTTADYENSPLSNITKAAKSTALKIDDAIKPYLPEAEDIKRGIGDSGITDYGYLSFIGGTAEKAIEVLTPAIEKNPELADNAAKKALDAIAGVKDVPADIAINEYEDFQESPTGYTAEQAALIASGYAFGAGAKLATISSRELLEKAGAKTSAKLVEPVLALGMTGVLGSEAVTTYEESGVKGLEKFGVDLAVGGIGFIKGTKHASALWDAVTVRGSELPVESMVSEDVLTGKSTLPETKPTQSAESIIKDFSTPEGTAKGWHASGDIMKDLTVRGVDAEGNIFKSRPGDNPGLYISGEQKGLSPHFLRVKTVTDTSPAPVEMASGMLSTAKSTGGVIKGTAGKVIGSSEEIFGRALKLEKLQSKGAELKTKSSKLASDSLESMSSPLHPNAMHIEVTGGVKRLPVDVRGSVSKSDQFLATKAEKGSAYLTTKLERNIKGGVAEHEATITPGTELKIISDNQYFKYSGRRVRVREAQTVRELTGEGKLIRDPNVKARTVRDLVGESRTIKELNRDYGTAKGVRGNYVPTGRDLVRNSSLDSMQGPAYSEITGSTPIRRTSTPTSPSYTPTRKAADPIGSTYQPSGRGSSYKPLSYPGYTPSKYSDYKPLSYPDYTPSKYPDYTPPQYPGYTPPKYPGYTPPKYPDYTPPQYPGYTPPKYTPPPTDPIINAPDALGKRKQTEIIDSPVMFGRRVKHHYVKDPVSFVLGTAGKKGRKGGLI